MRNTKQPRFQQRHYEALAEWISKEQDEQAFKERMVRSLIPFFKADNPKFSSSIFRAACGVVDE